MSVCVVRALVLFSVYADHVSLNAVEIGGAVCRWFVHVILLVFPIGGALPARRLSSSQRPVRPDPPP